MGREKGVGFQLLEGVGGKLVEIIVVELEFVVLVVVGCHAICSARHACTMAGGTRLGLSCC